MAGACATLAAVLAVSSRASAQSAETAQSGTASATPLQEIVVTAEKRSSTVQKTPISITAVSGADLQEQGISSFTEVAQETPGVSIRTSGPGQTEFEMRGLTSSGGESPTVGFYLDETPLTPPAGSTNGKVVIDPDLFDLNRVEVLRGPQGTLYGSGSMGGTIKLVTNQPSFDGFAGAAQVIGSGTDGGGLNHTENLMLNIPIVDDKVALRVVGTEQYTSGWIDRIVLKNFPLQQDYNPFATNGIAGFVRGNVQDAAIAEKDENVNDAESLGFRASLLIKPIDGLTITPSIFFERTSQGALDTIDNPPGVAALAHYEPYYMLEPFSDEFKLASAVIKYDFGGVEATSATSYWTRSEAQTQDESEVLESFLVLPSFPQNASIQEVDSTRQLSEEFRIQSTTDDPFQWLVGTFYSRFVSTYSDVSFVPDLVTKYGLPTGVVFNGVQPTIISQNAAFGQASYQITDELKATAGLRWYSYDTWVRTTFAGIVFNGSSIPDTTIQTASDSGFNPMFNIAYTPTDDLLVYATAAKGFRPGGANQAIPSYCGPAPTEYQPDSVWSYELGEKARLLDNRVTVNGDFYYEDWAGVQQTVTYPCGFFFTGNAGDAAVYGSELELSVKVTQALTFKESAGYTHATITKSVPGSSLVAGERLQSVPSWTSTTSLQYFEELNDNYQFVSRITNEFISSRTDATFAINHLPSYDLVNAEAGVIHGDWSVMLFANNLLNRHALLSDNESISTNIPSLNRVSTNQPLTVGVNISYNF